MTRSVTLGLALTCALTTTVWAEEDCTEAKDVLNVVEAFYASPDKLTNVITPEFTLRLKALDDRPMPQTIYYKFGDERMDFPLDATGRVTGLKRMAGKNPNGEVCSFRDQPKTDPDAKSMQANMAMRFAYKNPNGEHAITDLIEGAKDGSKIMNSLAPSGLGFLVPGLKRVGIKPVDDTTKLTIAVDRKGEIKSLDDIVRQNGFYMIDVKTLKRARADTLLISGGDYTIEAMFADED